MLYDFKIHFKGKFRIRYRGKSDYSKRYFREPNHCLQKYATSFAIPINEESYNELKDKNEVQLKIMMENLYEAEVLKDKSMIMRKQFRSDYTEWI